MTGAGEAGSFRATDTPLFYAFLAVLLWAPLPFASARPSGSALLCLLLALLALWWCLLALAGRAGVGRATWVRIRYPLLLFALAPAFVLLQLLPLPPGVLAILSPVAAGWQLDTGWNPISLDPAAGWSYWLRACTVALGFLLTGLLVRGRRRVRLLLGTFVVSGTFQAVYGVLMVLSGLELGFFVEKYVGRGAATGTFVNSNHLAGYLTMCLAAGTGLMLAGRRSSAGSGWRQRLRDSLGVLLSPRIGLRAFLVLMVVALLMTGSRAGLIAFPAALVGATALALVAARRWSASLLLLVGGLLLVDLLLVGQWFGLAELSARVAGSGSALAGDYGDRYWLNVHGLAYLRDFWLVGSGGGSFYGIFPNYQGAAMDGFFEHAHNDYLEYACELGLPVTAALLGAVALCAARAFQGLRRPDDRLVAGGSFAVLVVVAWAGLHSLVDFNLQIPANALGFAAILALGCVIGGGEKNRTR